MKDTPTILQTDCPVCIVAIMVAYDQARDPIASIQPTLGFVQHFILIDNARNGHQSLRGEHSREGLTILVNGNMGGLAGAYNLAIEYVNAIIPNATHLLFLDDDSDTDAVGSFLTSEITRRYLGEHDVAAVAPAYIDRETGRRGSCIELRRFLYKALPRDMDEATQVSFLINSMSLWSFAAIRRIGPYSTRLKVDHIDTDYCLRSKILGYKLILNPTVTFVHSIGKRRIFRCFGRILQAGGHSPDRREMIGRNTVLLAITYGWRFPSFAMLCSVRLVYECLGILLAEDAKVRKLLALGKGALMGLLGRRA